MSDALLSPSEIERQVRAAGLTMQAFCADARVAQSTFTRWKQGKAKPSLDAYGRFLETLSALPKKSSEQVLS